MGEIRDETDEDLKIMSIIQWARDGRTGEIAADAAVPALTFDAQSAFPIDSDQWASYLEARKQQTIALLKEPLDIDARGRGFDPALIGTNVSATPTAEPAQDEQAAAKVDSGKAVGDIFLNADQEERAMRGPLMTDAGLVDFYQGSDGAQAQSISALRRAQDASLSPAKSNEMAESNPQDVFTDGSIVPREFKNLEHGNLTPTGVHAIVLHRTDGASADSTLSAYKNKAEGAHFLVDNDGTIFQTANLNTRTWHVGKIRSRGKEENSWTPSERSEIAALEIQDKGNFAKLTRDLNDLELTKEYPTRYPNNADSIGIEVVGAYNKKSMTFEPASAEQLASVARLVEGLKVKFNLTNADVYHHGKLSYKDKNRTEGADLGY